MKFVEINIEYVVILTGENLSSTQVANMNLIYWPVRSTSMRRGGGIKESVGAYSYFSQLLGSLYKSIWKSGAKLK